MVSSSAVQLLIRTSACVAGCLLLSPLYGQNGTVAGTATAEAGGAAWVRASAPFTGDDNRNGTVLFEISDSGEGSPTDFWVPADVQLPFSGSPEWRQAYFHDVPQYEFSVFPGGTYYIRVTYSDPDGVTGNAVQILGPITTPYFGVDNPITLGTATAVFSDNEIAVNVPFDNDDNLNSTGVIDIATSPGGPWTRKVSALPVYPKRARIRSLIPGTEYWVRVTIDDPDGIDGEAVQLLGPITYNGARNLAFQRPVTADTGYDCCTDPRQLTDGIIQYENESHGFAWAGGGEQYGDVEPGWKQATIDLGANATLNRATVWLHEPDVVPVEWKFQYSNDNVNWTDASSGVTGQCLATVEGDGGTFHDSINTSWLYPACANDATFDPVTARYFRYTFNDTDLRNAMHGWAVEIEVFGSRQLTVSQSPLTFVALEGSAPQTQQVTLSGLENAPDVSTSVASPPTPDNIHWLAASILPPGTNGLSVVVTPSGLTAGAYAGAVTLTAPEVSNSPVTVPVNLTVIAPLRITTGCPISGAIGYPYEFSPQAAGGTAPYHWSAQGLPPGIAINSETGVIAGVPTGPFIGTLSITVTDSSGQYEEIGTLSATQSDCAITISPSLVITSCPAGTAVEGRPYSSVPAATGGVPGYQWSVAPSALPPGLAMVDAATGQIAGTPTGGGGTFILTVHDSGQVVQTATRECSISTTAQLSIATSCPLPTGEDGTPYALMLRASGGSGTYTWSAITLPPGLSLNPATGVLRGTLAQGTYPISVQVTDSGSGELKQTATFTCNIVINPPPLQMISGCPASPISQGDTVSFPLAASGGTGTYSWGVVEGQPARRSPHREQ